jgi:hemerythrin-like metal-binding protein
LLGGSHAAEGPIAHPCRQALVVDDDAGVREVIADALNLEEIEVVPARGGGEAIAALDGGCRPGVILLDLLMPGVSGERLLPLLRQHPSAHGVPIVVMSASPERLARIEGPDARLAKPFHLDALLATIDRLCAGGDGERVVLGIPLVDAQHEGQRALAGALVETLRDGGEAAAAAKVLDELIDRTREHFASEGELIRRHRYPDSALHFGEHARYLADLERCRVALYGPNLPTVRDVAFLKTSMDVHIASMDRDLARHLGARGIG